MLQATKLKQTFNFSFILKVHVLRGCAKMHTLCWYGQSKKSSKRKQITNTYYLQNLLYLTIKRNLVQRFKYLLCALVGLQRVQVPAAPTLIFKSNSNKLKINSNMEANNLNGCTAVAVQSVVNNECGYTTFAYDEAQEVYKMGFAVHSIEYSFVAIAGMNDEAEFAGEMGISREDVFNISRLEIGQACYAGSFEQRAKYMRIW